MEKQICFFIFFLKKAVYVFWDLVNTWSNHSQIGGYAHFYYLSPLSSISSFQVHYKGAWFNVLGLCQPYTFGSLWPEHIK